MTIQSKLQLHTFKKKLLHWANQTSTTVVYLDSNLGSGDPYAKYECVLAVGEYLRLESSFQDNFNTLKEFATQYQQEWIFGYLGYDLKNELEQLTSNNQDSLALPPLYFFIPIHVVTIGKDLTVSIYSKEASESEILAAIQKTTPATHSELSKPISITPNLSKENYLSTIERIQQHIVEGDVYEINFCQEFSATADINSLAIFEQLNASAKTPFAAYLTIGTHQLICASPERFLCKRGNKVISQPIKGTRPRGKTIKEDEALKKALLSSEKDRAENVMIVDLVRNDLTKTAQTGSIQVEELFGIYSFANVHQMISTVTAVPRENTSWVEVIEQAFPMGSMTGAPKVMSMQLIEQYEQTKRGLYSGAVGYVSPDQDFDFNVVIRSILYRPETSYLSVQVGGAIVYDSIPEEEYQECLDKVRNILEVLGGDINKGIDGEYS